MAMVYDPLNFCRIQFANILSLLRSFMSIFMRDIGLHFLFLYHLCLVLVSESQCLLSYSIFFGMAKER